MMLYWHCVPFRLVKAGLLDKKYAKRFSTISAWAELVGYVGNVTLNGLRIAAALERELMLTQELVRRKKVYDLCQMQVCKNWCSHADHVSSQKHCLVCVNLHPWYSKTCCPTCSCSAHIEICECILCLQWYWGYRKTIHCLMMSI